MTPFDERFPHRLESALAAPFVESFGFDPYPTLADKCAVMLYHVAKAHAFENGNKRMALTCTNALAYLNGYEWAASSDQAATIVETIAASKGSSAKDTIVQALREAHFPRYLVRIVRPQRPIIVQAARRHPARAGRVQIRKPLPPDA